MDNILDLPMQENDAGAKTVRDYLFELLSRLLAEGEYFSGKRPFGNSGWDWELFMPLVVAGKVRGELDSDGFLEDVDEAEAMRLILEALSHLAQPTQEE